MTIWPFPEKSLWYFFFFSLFPPSLCGFFFVIVRVVVVVWCVVCVASKLTGQQAVAKPRGMCDRGLIMYNGYITHTSLCSLCSLCLVWSSCELCTKIRRGRKATRVGDIASVDPLHPPLGQIPLWDCRKGYESITTKNINICIEIYICVCIYVFYFAIYSATHYFINNLKCFL